MRVLVTGATGFIGQKLVKKLLEEKNKVIALVRKRDKKTRALKKQGVKVVLASLENKSLLEKIAKDCQIVFHLAAEKHEGLSQEVYQVNISGTKNLLEACPQNCHFIFISSAFVLGKTSKEPLKESSPPRPRTFYALSKLKAENLVKTLAKKKGSHFTIIRPTMVYGPDDKIGPLPKLYQLLKLGLCPIPGSGRNQLQFIFIDDLVRGLTLVAKTKARDRTYNFAYPNPISLNHLLKLIYQQANLKTSQIHLPVIIFGLGTGGLEVIWKIGRKTPIKFFQKPIPYSSKNLEILTQNWLYDSTKAKKELKFVAKTGYKEGIKKTISWLKIKR